MAMSVDIYSFKKLLTYANTFFDENFGRSDFKELNPVLLKRGGTLWYLTKYIAKTGDKMVYSRGVPAEICKELPDSDIAGTYLDFVTKYVLYNDVIDWDRDIKDYGEKRKIFFLGGNVDLFKGQSECGSAWTRGARRILAYKNIRKFLKCLQKKE